MLGNSKGEKRNENGKTYGLSLLFLSNNYFLCFLFSPFPQLSVYANCADIRHATLPDAIIKSPHLSILTHVRLDE